MSGTHDPGEFLARNYEFIRKNVFKLNNKLNANLPEEELEDIIGDIAEKILKGAMDGFQGLSKDTTYLYSIIRSKFIDHLRKYNRLPGASYDENPSDEEEDTRHSSQASSYSPDLEAHVLRQEVLDEVYGALEQMKPTRRGVALLILEHHLTQKDVCERLKLKPATVSEHWSNAKKEIEQKVRKKFPDITMEDLEINHEKTTTQSIH